MTTCMIREQKGTTTYMFSCMIPTVSSICCWISVICLSAFPCPENANTSAPVSRALH